MFQNQNPKQKKEEKKINDDGNFGFFAQEIQLFSGKEFEFECVMGWIII